VDKAAAYLGAYFGAGGFAMTNDSQPQGAFFLTSSKVLDSEPSSQQVVRAGSRWSKKPMSIDSKMIAPTLYKHTALAEGGNSVIYTDSHKPPCDYTFYFPFAALGKNQSIYTKRTFSQFNVVKDGQCIGGYETSPELFDALTIPLECCKGQGEGGGSVTVIPRRFFRYRYRPRFNLAEEIYIGNERVAQSQSEGSKLLSYEVMYCEEFYLFGCGSRRDGCLGPIPGHDFLNPLKATKIISGASESAAYKDEYVSPLYYDGFLLRDKPYVILFYSKHRVDTTESMPTNDYLVLFVGASGCGVISYDWVGHISPYKSVTKIESVHTYEFYIVCMFDGTVTLHEQICKIQGTYTTTQIYDQGQTRTEYKFTPSHGTIPTCVSCQISKHGAVYTYLEYRGKYPEGLDGGASTYLTGQNRVIGIVSPTKGHKVYKGEEAKKILQNMVKSEYEYEGKTETFEQDFSIDPKKNIAIGMFPCLRWGDK
jgi:hypothetical protein